MRKTLAITLLMLMLVFSQPSQAQETWSEPLEISALSEALAPNQATPTPITDGQREINYGSAWFPDITSNPQGDLFVVWYSGLSYNINRNFDLLMYRERKNGNWSYVNNLATTGSGGDTMRSSVVTGGDGKLHALVRTRNGQVYMSAPWDEAWYAKNWYQSPLLSGAGTYYNAIALDSQGGIHGVWNEVTGTNPNADENSCINCSELYYRNSFDYGRTWSHKINVSELPEGSMRPQIAVDRNNVIHLVWDEGADRSVNQGTADAGVYRRSLDRGATWEEPVIFRVDDDPIVQTSLAVTREGNPFVVYRGTLDSSAIYFQFSQDGGARWSEPQQIPGILARIYNQTPYDTYALAVDGSNNIHLFASAYIARPELDMRIESPDLLHLVYSNGQWSAPEAIMDNELYPEWPKVTIHNGNQLHVVWFTRSEQDLYVSENSQYKVWYSSRSISAQTQTALPLLTATPIIVPSATPLPPTITPTPTIAPEVLSAPVIDGPMTWEQRGMITIASAIAPAVIVVLLVIGIFWWNLRRERNNIPPNF
jgi:hypothetical protein